MELEAAEDEMLSFSLAVTGMDGIRSEEVRGMLDVWEVNPERREGGYLGGRMSRRPGGAAERRFMDGVK